VLLPPALEPVEQYLCRAKGKQYCVYDTQLTAVSLLQDVYVEALAVILGPTDTL
jgi:hypothetical protein